MVNALSDATTPEPSITFIVPVPTSGEVDLGSVFQSLFAQSDASWQAVIVARSYHATENASLARDERILVVPLHDGQSLGDAINLGIEAALGKFVAVISPNDVLVPDAVSALRDMVAISPDAEVIYSDESRLDGQPTFAKPAFSPERLRSQFYFGNATVYRRSRLNALGGVRQGLDGAELYDLALRVTREVDTVAHVGREMVSSSSPRLEVLWGISLQESDRAVRAVLEEHLGRTGGGVVDGVFESGVHRTHRLVQGEPLISIVIPTRGSTAVVRGVERCMVVEAVKSVVELSTYTNYEFVVVIDDVAGPSVYRDLTEIAGDRIRFVEWSKPFSFSEKMNLGVLHSRGEFVLLLNDDVELITPGWMEALLALAQRPSAGLVGAMLYFEDDTIQHAGHAYYHLDVSHIGLNSQRGASGPAGGFLVEREVAGVTCACALMAKSVFLEAGGFSTLLPGNFNDVDLCMKVASLGYQSYWTPRAELYHFESRSRDPKVSAYEIRTAWNRWEHLFWDSPYWPMNPHELFRSEGEIYTQYKTLGDS